MNKPISATALLRRPDGKFLMQLRDDGRGIVIPYPNTWNFPGGTVELGESPFEAVLREIAEEFEITVKPSDCKEIWSYTHAHATIDHIFLCFTSAETKPVLHEGADCKWMSFAEIEELKLGFDQEKIVAYLKTNIVHGSFF
jgi:8-oxo-dGTP diphosphatase